MRISRKSDFWRMSLTKSLVLKLHGSPNARVKRPKTLTLIHKRSNFDVNYKNHHSKRRKLGIHQNTCNLQCFEQKPAFEDPPLGPSLASHLGARHDSQAFWRGFWRGLECALMENFPETASELSGNEFLSSNTLMNWGIVRNMKNQSEKVTRMCCGSRPPDPRLAL